MLQFWLKLSGSLRQRATAAFIIEVILTIAAMVLIVRLAAWLIH